MTELNEKAISIKGKDYVLVKDRIIYFNETYPNGSIQTQREKDWDMEIVKAFVVPDIEKPNRMFTWYSQAKWGNGLVNKDAALENAETSAVWRALAMMGIGVIDSVASADEMRKIPSDSIQEKTEHANTSEPTKPWFNKEQLDMFVKCAWKYENADEALKVIKWKYKIGKEKEAEVRKLYDNIELIKWSSEKKTEE